MSLPTLITQTYTAILREELVPAMGCTEPIAIAYAASILRHALGADPTTLRVELSGNIIKNVKSVIVPATDGMHGIEAAVAAGIVAGCPDRKLEVLCALKPADADRIRDFLAATTPAVSELETKHPFELVMTGEATVEGQAVTVTVHLMDRHTNVVSVDRNGQDLTDRYLYGESLVHTEPADRSLLNVQDIITYAEEVDLDEVRPLLERQIAMNMAIAEEGLRCEYGASIGRLLYNGGHCDLRTKARAYAAAGSDARMNGCELPVCIISGSGNQGMTASVPVVVYAKAWHTDNETPSAPCWYPTSSPSTRRRASAVSRPTAVPSARAVGADAASATWQGGGSTRSPTPWSTPWPSCPAPSATEPRPPAPPRSPWRWRRASWATI